MIAFLQLWWKPVVMAVVLGYATITAYGKGGAHVQQKWDAENTRVANALVENAKVVRAKEQALQDSMNEVQVNASAQIERLAVDAGTATDAAERLRVQVDKLLAADRTRQAAGTCTSRAASENPGNLLAVVLDKSIQRNRELAAFADVALTAANACAAGFKGVRSR